MIVIIIETTTITNTIIIIVFFLRQIGCCGADGPNDYLALRHALPTECRDTVTGNAFFYGCAEEVTWFLEYKSRWTTNIAIAIAALEVRHEHTRCATPNTYFTDFHLARSTASIAVEPY